MKSNPSYLVIILAIMAGVPAATGSGLWDLGTASTRGSWVTYPYPETALYMVDVSSDGTLAGGTDASGNAFVWTPTYGKVTLGTSVRLQGVDWLSGNVLAVGNGSGS